MNRCTPPPLVFAIATCLAVVPQVWGMQRTRKFIPPPLRVYIPFESAWKGMLETLKEKNHELAQESRSRGYVVTQFREYISGPLTESHLAKIGEKSKLLDGEWVRVKYQFEILVELVQARETLVTVHANIKALKRAFLGAETWVDVPTNGQLEEDLLTRFGRSLFGQSFNLRQPRKGFWEREPTYVPDLEERIPKVIGPERPPSE